jgi:dTDP-glucose 4,6-dehydratase
MRRVLITGAGGFIGHHVLEHVLARTDWRVVATDSFRHKGRTDRIAQVLGHTPKWRGRVQVVMHDLAAPVASQLAAKIGNVDYVIALASLSHVDDSIRDPVGFTRNNTDIALSTLEYARDACPRHVIWVSTDEVYGPVEGGHAHGEWAPIVPSNPYAASKAAQEALCTAYWRTYQVPVSIVNCMNLIGERQDPQKYLPTLIWRIAHGEIVTVHGTPDDIGSRHYLHARNLADGVVFLLSGRPAVPFPLAGRPGRYNIAGPDRVTNLELAERVAEILGQELFWQLEDFHTTRPGHDPHYGLDGALLAGLGWKPPVPFGPSLEKTVLWSRKHPEWLAP